MSIYEHDPALRFTRIMPSSSDIELNLLKGHLLIEEVLTAVIQAGLRRPEHLSFKRMHFSAKAKLARAVFKGLDEPWVWKAVGLLNDARNSLAHGLDSYETADLIRKFEAYVRSQEKSQGMTGFDEGAEMIEHIRWAIFAIFSRLIVYGDVREPRANALAEALRNWPPNSEAAGPEPSGSS